MPPANPCEEPPKSTLHPVPDSSSRDGRLHCPVPSCDACRSVAQLETEILRAEERVSKLKRKLVSLKSNVNKCHDPLSRLPAELVSEIFKSYCANPETFGTLRSRAPLVIGGVCRRWREITLVTPQLWAEVRIRSHINKPYDLAVATEWLSRSRSLPLTLDIKFDTDYDSAEPPEDNSFLPLIRLLRSHSSRWRDMSIDTFWESSIIPPLFANLETLPSNFGELYLATTIHDTRWTSNTRLSPQALEVAAGSSSIGFPLKWDRLTALYSIGRETLYLDELLNIIENAPMLTHCAVTSITIPVDADEFAFSFRDLPIINHSITILEIQTPTDASENLLGYLTLPSLAILRYEYQCHSAEDTDLVILKDFLIRSSPPLNEFHLTIIPNEPNYVDIWRHKEFPVTSLEFDALEGEHQFEDEIQLTKDFMTLLSITLDDGGLPKLRSLQFNLPAITPEFWSNLCDVIQKSFQISSSDSVPDGPVCAESQPMPRGLQSVLIDIYLRKSPVSMDATVYSRLIEFGHSGLSISVRDGASAMPRPFHQLHVDTLPPKI